MQLTQTHPDVDEVLDILGRADPAPEDQISAFTASANRKEVSGDLARHARWKGDSPKRTMTLVEARQLIGSVVITWLDWLRSSSSP